MMTLKTPEQVARIILGMTRGKPDLTAIESGYIKNAAEMREYASKASAAKSGKFRGYTVAHATETAEMCERYAKAVPAALRAMLAH